MTLKPARLLIALIAAAATPAFAQNAADTNDSTITSLPVDTVFFYQQEQNTLPADYLEDGDILPEFSLFNMPQEQNIPQPKIFQR